MIGRQDYEDRRTARIDALHNAAQKAAAESSAKITRAFDLVKDIPLGQPNIIGRPQLPALREKSARIMDKALELGRTSEYYAEKADSAESNRAISSDDPNALAKLQTKLDSLIAEQSRVKASNAQARKTGGSQSEWYVLPYLARDIKSVKERIAKLQAVENMPAETISFDGGEIESDPITNRVIIRYDERQPQEIVDRLKANGYKWSPTANGWQRLRTPTAWKHAKWMCNVSAL